MYSLSIRKKILDIKEREALSFEALGKRFAIHPRTIQRWRQRIEPKTKRDKPATKIDMEVLAKDVEKDPDAYQWERAEKLKVSQSAVFYALKRLGKSYKKNSVSSKSR